MSIANIVAYIFILYEYRQITVIQYALVIRLITTQYVLKEIKSL